MLNTCTSNFFTPSCELCYKLDFASKELIIMHWRYECLGMKVKCGKCDVEIERVCMPDHDCVDELKQVIRLKDSKIELLEYTIKQLRSQINTHDDMLDDLEEAFYEHRYRIENNMTMHTEALDIINQNNISLDNIHD